MHLIVSADDKQRATLLSKNKDENIHFDFVKDSLELLSHKNADAIFVLNDDINQNLIQSLTTQPVFIHSVILTLTDLNLPDNISRINAWPTFLQNDTWEIVTKKENIVKTVFERLGWKYILLPDEPGFISARIVAMIINEAYFTYGDNVSSKEEIDLAMKLGTNYPYGPFEWSKKIGLTNIYKLLKTLNKNSNRYYVAPALEKELINSMV